MLALIVLSLPFVLSVKVCISPRQFARQFSRNCIDVVVGSFEIEARNLLAFTELLNSDEYNYRQHYDIIVESPERTEQLQTLIKQESLHGEPLLSVSKLVINPQLAQTMFSNGRRYSGVLVSKLPVNNLEQVEFYWSNSHLFRRIICYALENQMHLVEDWDWLYGYLNVAGSDTARWLLFKIGVDMSAAMLYRFVYKFPSLMSAYLEWSGPDYLLQAINVHLVRLIYGVQLTSAQLHALKRGCREVTNIRLLQLVEWVLSPSSGASQKGYSALLESLYRLALFQNNRIVWTIIGHVIRLCDLFYMPNCAEIVAKYLQTVKMENTCPWMARALISKHHNISSPIITRFPATFIPYQRLPLPLVRSLWLRDSPLTTWIGQALPVRDVSILIKNFQRGIMGLPVNLDSSLDAGEMCCTEWFITKFTSLGPSDKIELLRAMIVSWPYLIFQRLQVRHPLIYDDVDADWETYFHRLTYRLDIDRLYLLDLWELAGQTNVMTYFTPSTLQQLLTAKQ
ncbi:hypothetical protein PSACC_03565 [Paramicrosporidium saccamoebae]|uniref:Uncharacterized protein n=1 Tax=Paramicrosporidium saccamoebae TaxID=1246581 RepID=A0A2H9TFY3_9FUNG|nr:hypothetical protein PSACC_03565 [Paramicrosporidium saccamoebae]